MNRRELLGAAGAVVLAAATSPGSAEETGSAARMQKMEGMKMDGMEGMKGMHDHGAMTPPYQALVDAATDCTEKGLVCLNHCLQSFLAGDLGMAACARAVDQMYGMSVALAKIASTGSPHLPLVAKAAMAFCIDCEKECRKHAEMHAVCKACADACLKAIDECKKVIS